MKCAETRRYDVGQPFSRALIGYSTYYSPEIDDTTSSLLEIVQLSCKCFICGFIFKFVDENGMFENFEKGQSSKISK